MNKEFVVLSYSATTAISLTGIYGRSRSLGIDLVYLQIPVLLGHLITINFQEFFKYAIVNITKIGIDKDKSHILIVKSYLERL